MLSNLFLNSNTGNIFYLPSDKFNIIPPLAQTLIDRGGPPSIRLKPGEIPPVAISWGSTEFFKTGAWRNITPRYIRQLPPCRSGCPVGNDVEGWLSAAAESRWEDAVDLLIEEQPLPSVCGRVCYHPCETACNRGKFDAPVSIRAVERYLGDRAYRLKKLPLIPESTRSSARVLVLGSGPAGLAAAWTLVRLGHSVEIRDTAHQAGGLLRYGIPAYRLPPEILDRELDRVRQLGVNFQLGVSHSRTGRLSDFLNDFDSLFLAPGASGHRSSGIKGDTDGIVIGAIDFLRQTASGKTPSIGDNVVVIGGGNSAVDAARTAVRLGSEVTILYRRTRTEMPAYFEEIEAAIEEGVEFRYLSSPRFLSRSGGIKLTCIRNELGKTDDSGRRRPEPVPGSEFDLMSDTIIDAVGEYPDPNLLTSDSQEISGLENRDWWGRTGLNGVWVGGDYIGKERTVAYAIGTGKRAALSIDSYLRGDKEDRLETCRLGENGSLMVGNYVRGITSNGYDIPGTVLFEELNKSYYTHNRRNRAREIAPDARTYNYSEIVTGLKAASVIREAGRCFHCGRCDECGNCHVFCPDGAVVRNPDTRELSFDYEHCKGCGICAAECPRATIDFSNQVSK